MDTMKANSQQEQMLAMLEWASDHPDRWHSIEKLEATQKAAELLGEARRGPRRVLARARVVGADLTQPLD
jgi:hypothetical protein